MRLEELLLAAEVVLGGDQIGLGLAESAKALPTSGDSMIASAAPFFTRSPGSARMRFTRPVTGEKMCATRRSSNETLPLVTISLPTACSADRLDLDLGVADLLRRQPDLAFGRRRRARWWRPARSGSRPSGAAAAALNSRAARRAQRDVSTRRGRHCTTCVAVAASIWKMAFQ